MYNKIIIHHSCNLQWHSVHIFLSKQYICTVVHTLCIWGHKDSMYTNVPENLTFVCPRYKYKYLNIKAGEGGRG